MKFQGLREVYQITDWKDDCVYRTKFAGYAWVTYDHVSENKDIMFCSLSTKVSSELKMSQTNRKVSDDTPDVVTTTL